MPSHVYVCEIKSIQACYTNKLVTLAKKER